MKWPDSSKIRVNKSHKRKYTETCIVCRETIEVVYDGDNKAIKTLCKCGVKEVER